MKGWTRGARQRRATIVAGIGVWLATASPLAAQPEGLPKILPLEFETRAALSAAPERVAADAGVWVLGPDGYEEARPTQNGFECFVMRDLLPGGRPDRQSFAPMCFDAEGARTVLKRFIERSALVRGEGMSPAEADEVLAKADERFTPQRPGITYMASAVNVQTDPTAPRGAFRTYMPHVMFLAPGLSDAQISAGAIQADPAEAFFGGWPFLPGRARPDGFVVVPLDRRLRLQIQDTQRDLIDRLAEWIPVREPVDYGGE